MRILLPCVLLITNNFEKKKKELFFLSKQSSDQICFKKIVVMFVVPKTRDKRDIIGKFTSTHVVLAKYCETTNVQKHEKMTGFRIHFSV